MQEIRKDFSLEKQCGCIQSPPPESTKNRLDKCCYCHMDIAAPALDKGNPASLWGCCLVRAILASLSGIQTPGSAGAALLRGDTLAGQKHIPESYSLCTMVLGWQSTRGSSQVEKAVGGHVMAHTCPAMVSQVLMELSRCS